jgi:phage terminase large subunit-like protein
MVDESLYEFDAPTADYACRWIETHCVFTNDKWAGKPFKLADWERDDIIRPLFGWKRKADGLRRYRRVIVWVPRKNGKTELAAAVSLIALVATGVMGGEVYSIAKDKDQARIVFDKAAVMVAYSQKLSAEVEPLKSSLFVPKLGAKFEPMSGVPQGKHGRSASALIGDEVHEWPDDRLYTFMHQSTGAREEPIEFLISTAGTQEGYGWELWQECQKILDGTIDDPQTLIVIYAAGEDDDWTSEATWAKANPNLGVSVRLDYLQAECRKAQENPRLENDFKRYHLNMWTEQDVRWLSMELWRKCSTDPTDLDLWRRLPALMKGRKAFAGIDLSSTSDITAMVAVFPPDDEWPRWVVLPKFWVPKATIERRTRVDRVPYETWAKLKMIETTPGTTVDYDYITKDAYAWMEEFELRKFGFDRWNATQTMIQMEAEGAGVVKVGQGFASLTAPSKELERLVVSGELEHGNHPVLTWMARNAGYETDAAGNLKPSKAKSKEKIDGIAALVNSLFVALNDDGGGGPSVYAERGLLVA